MGEGRLVLDGSFSVSGSIADSLTFEANLGSGDFGEVTSAVEIDLVNVIGGRLDLLSTTRIGRGLLSGGGTDINGGGIGIGDVVRITDRFDWLGGGFIFGGFVFGGSDPPGTLEIDASASFNVLGSAPPFADFPEVSSIIDQHFILVKRMVVIRQVCQICFEQGNNFRRLGNIE